VRDKRGLIPLPVNEIVWLKADGDYTTIYTVDKNFLVDTTLKEFTKKLNPKTSSAFTVRRLSILTTLFESRKITAA
jgi:hypothetical protein